MLQYKIPQNVGIEDRIVGPLTLRQLIILVVGFGISYVFFAILNKLYELNILEYIIIAIPAVVAAAVALIKINDIRLPKFILMFLEFSIKPKKRLWDHRGIASLVAPDLTEIKKGEETPEDVLGQKAKKSANLDDLTQVLDSGGFEHLETIDHKEIDEVHDDDLMAQAYFGHKDSSTGNMYWRTKESHKKMLDLFAKLPVTKLKKGSKEAAIAQKEIAKAKQEAEEAKAEKQKSVQPAPASKKPRKRKRKVPQPVRKNNLINTTGKNTPAEYIPKPPPKKTAKPQKPEAGLPGPEKPKKDKKGGEFKFEELKKGEIEINLD